MSNADKSKNTTTLYCYYYVREWGDDTEYTMTCTPKPAIETEKTYRIGNLIIKKDKINTIFNHTPFDHTPHGFRIYADARDDEKITKIICDYLTNEIDSLRDMIQYNKSTVSQVTSHQWETVD